MSREKAKKTAFWHKGAGTVLLLLFVLFFFLHPSWYHTAAQENTGSGLLTGRVLVTLAEAFAGLFALWVPCPLRDLQRRLLGVFMSLFTVAGMFFALEYANIYAQRLPLQVVRELGEKKVLLSCAVLLLLLLWLLVLLNRWQRAGRLMAALVCLYGVISRLVVAFRGVPFLASDLSVLRTAANVAASYRIEIDYPSFALIGFTLCWFMLLGWTGSEKVLKRRIFRGAALIAVLLLSVLGNRLYLHTDLLKSHHVTFNTFKPQKSFGKNGSILTFLRSAQMLVVEPPKDYSPEAVQKIADAYPGQAQEKAQPNVIIVMDEAFCDLQSWMDFETDGAVCPFFESLTENTIRGRLYVSSYGGRTANTEYEVLTEDSVSFLPPGSTPYQLYVKAFMPNLDSALELEGYENTVGMHPYDPSGYNRRRVYELFGFDKLLFLDSFHDAQRVWGRVSDEEDVDRIILEYENARSRGDAPFFLHNVTMQNHSPYEADAESLGDAVHILEEGEYPDAETYLTLIRKSDRALEKLVGYFSRVQEPTVLLFFGDHQPKLSDDFYRMVYGRTMNEMEGEELMQFYFSNYVIWANFDIEEEETDLSSNYLIPVMKEAAGMQLTGYEQFLLDLRQELPIVSLNGYWDREGTYYESVEDPDSGWYDRLEQYHKLVYNHLLDAEHREDRFFEGVSAS